jgi:hypothetical protein
MKLYNGLPIYKMTVNENDTETGVEFISLVDHPAIEKNFIAMANMKMYASKTDKQILTGPAMIPDLPIYRNDANLGEYYVSFDSSEIEKIAKKFNKEQRTLGINYQHESNSQVESAVIIEQWFITDKQNDKSNSLGFDLPVGTWMVSVYIANSDFWNTEIKSGNVRGFSIEGFLNMQMAAISKMSIAKLISNLEKLNKKINNKMEIKMKATIKTVDGMELYTPQDSFVVGSEVYTMNDTEQVSLGNDTYTLENGVLITVVDSKITEVVEPETEVEVKHNNDQLVVEDFTPEVLSMLMDKLDISALVERITALETINAELKSENKELKDKFSKTPGTAATTNSNDTDVVLTKMKFEDKVNAIMALRKK